MRAKKTCTKLYLPCSENLRGVIYSSKKEKNYELWATTRNRRETNLFFSAAFFRVSNSGSSLPGHEPPLRRSPGSGGEEAMDATPGAKSRREPPPVPPNYVSLRHLQELRLKEKEEQERRRREEEEAAARREAAAGGGGRG